MRLSPQMSSLLINDMKQFKNILRFLAVVIVAFALVCTCLGAFNYAYVSKAGFYAVCGAITLIAGGWGIYKLSRWSLESFTYDKNK